MLHSTSFDTDYNGPLICLQKNQLHSIKHTLVWSCTEFFIWPKSTVEKSSKEEMLWQDCTVYIRTLSYEYIFLYMSSNIHEVSVNKSKALEGKQEKCFSREGNKCTFSLVKKDGTFIAT